MMEKETTYNQMYEPSYKYCVERNSEDLQNEEAKGRPTEEKTAVAVKITEAPYNNEKVWSQAMGHSDDERYPTEGRHPHKEVCQHKDRHLHDKKQFHEMELPRRERQLHNEIHSYEGGHYHEQKSHHDMGSPHEHRYGNEQRESPMKIDIPNKVKPPCEVRQPHEARQPCEDGKLHEVRQSYETRQPYEGRQPHEIRQPHPHTPKQPHEDRNLHTPKQPHKDRNLHTPKQSHKDRNLHTPKQPHEDRNLHTPKQPRETRHPHEIIQPHEDRNLHTPKQSHKDRNLHTPKQPHEDRNLHTPKQPHEDRNLHTPKLPYKDRNLHTPKQPHETRELYEAKQPCEVRQPHEDIKPHEDTKSYGSIPSHSDRHFHDSKHSNDDRHSHDSRHSHDDRHFHDSRYSHDDRHFHDNRDSHDNRHSHDDRHSHGDMHFHKGTCFHKSTNPHEANDFPDKGQHHGIENLQEMSYSLKINSDVVAWTIKEIHTLIKRMNHMAFNVKNKSCWAAVKSVDWEKVAFDPYSAEDCKTKFRFLLKRIGATKTMTALLSEMEGKIASGEITKHLVLQPKNLFIKNFLKVNKNIEPKNLFSAAHKAWENLPSTEKDAYAKFVTKANKNVIPSNDEPPCIPKSPFEIFYNHQCAKNKMKNLEFKKLMKAKYFSLSPAKKLKYISLSAQDLYIYELEASKYRERHPEWICNIRRGPSKEESEMYLRYIGMPSRPPRTAFLCYYYEMLKKGKYNNVQAMLRQFYASEDFRKLSPDEKEMYRRISKERQEKYVAEFSAWREKQDVSDQILADKFLNKKQIIEAPLIPQPLKKTLSNYVGENVYQGLKRKIFTSSNKNSSADSEEEPLHGPCKSALSGTHKNVFPGPYKSEIPGPYTSEIPGSYISEIPGPYIREISGPYISEFPGPYRNASANSEENALSNVDKNASTSSVYSRQKQIEHVQCPNIIKESSCISKQILSDNKRAKMETEMMGRNKEIKNLSSIVTLNDFIRQFMPKPEEDLISKIDKLKQWKILSRELQLNNEEEPMLKDCLKRLNDNYERCIYTDVSRLSTECRRRFFSSYRHMLEYYFGYDIFENMYPSTEYPPLKYPIF
ncbi:uncharacterized protein [Procambarus clarkii]|uniref:uncharacterized protein n=1 Tax=Procambarus clarkii TaxID=6728 RepID=UPI003741FF41